MAKFNKKKKGVPAVSTASLPDVVFMILFFFMVSTSMREVEMKVENTIPSASETVKLENKSLTSYIYVGPPTKALKNQFGDAPRIQLNDAYATANEIQAFVAAERSNLDETERNGMTISLKIDEDTRMGIVTEVKTALRRAEAYQVSYAAKKPAMNE